MKKNTRGSILVTAIIIIMVIMVILGAALTIASSYYKASVNENTKKRVYLSAKSSVDLVSMYIEQGNSKVIPTKVGETIIIDAFEVENDIVDKSGSIKMVDDKTIKVVITASFNDYTYEIQADMKKVSLNWAVQSYCKAKAGDLGC